MYTVLYNPRNTNIADLRDADKKDKIRDLFISLLIRCENNS